MKRVDDVRIFPPEVEKLMFDIHYITNADSNCKLNVSTKTYSSLNFIDSIYRTLSGESRQVTLKWIDECIERIPKICDKYPDFKHIILHELDQFREALNRLSTVYKSDPNIKGNFKMFFQKLDLIQNKV